MNIILPILEAILHHPFYTILILWGIFKYKDLKMVLSEDDKGEHLSSRRVIAMLSAMNLFHTITYSVTHNLPFNTSAGWTDAVMCLVCLGLVAVGDLSGLLDKLNSLKTTSTTTTSIATTTTPTTTN